MLVPSHELLVPMRKSKQECKKKKNLEIDKFGLTFLAWFARHLDCSKSSL